MTIYDTDFLAEQEQQYTGVKDAVAGNQEVEFQEPKASETNQDHIVHSNEMIEPVSEKEFNFKALRDSIAQEKAEREAERHRYQQELETMRSQMSQMSSTTNENQISRKDPLDGLSGDDLLTVDKFRQAQQEQQQRYEEELTTLRYENLENRARLQHPDYNEVMDKYSIPLLRNNRDFARAFQNAENPAEFAYEIGRMQMASTQQKAPEPQVSQEAQRIVANANKPGTLSSARGGQPTISKADYYGSLSDKDFAAEVLKNLEEV